jgi:glycolate oxidase FAD binding subunit
MALHEPDTATDVQDVVQAAVSAKRSLAVSGLGSKDGIGQMVRADDQLTLSRLTGILSYEPEELVLTAWAGTRLSEVQAALDGARQHFAFEPFRPGALLGTSDQTLGGMIAAGLAGPRRIQAGSVRDHILGFAGVSGRGEAFKAGGKVVKNVTGFDLSKLMAGSWGTLAVLTEVTLKVLPRPETEASLLVDGLTDAEAATLMARAMGSPAEVSGAGVVGGVVMLRLEGIAVSVEDRLGLLQALAGRAARVLRDAASAALWADLRDGVPVADGPGAVWRVSCAPMQGHRLVAALRQAGPVEAAYDWQGGLMWLRLDTLIRATPTERASLAVFQPAEPALAALNARVRAAFDPLGILNPGRMG